jgi:DNA-directed RNA polymerase specialized sigma24 family protein
MPAVMNEPGEFTKSVNDAIAGKPGALSRFFELLHASYLPKVNAIIERYRWKYGNSLEMEDLRQEVLALLLELIRDGKVRTQPSRHSLFAFLSSLARNISRDAFKHNNAQKRAERPVELPDDIKSPPTLEHSRQALGERLNDYDDCLANRGIKQETRDLIWEYIRCRFLGFSDTDILKMGPLKKSHLKQIRLELNYLENSGSNE